jgi:hypothetical protein
MSNAVFVCDVGQVAGAVAVFARIIVVHTRGARRA